MMSGGGGGDQFPVGLRVLVVDDDITCLKILDHMLQRCRYRVTTCCQATVALSLLREKRGSFDVVISDVHMPDMNGFKLLELVGLEMDLPVIMMSADGGTHTVMRGIKHGACDYLIKPVRIEELKNIWQHVIRKKWNGNRELEYSGCMDDSERTRRVIDETEYASSVNDGSTDGSWKSHKKKRDAKEDEDDGELDDEDLSSSKKPRVVWSVELHQQFVSAVSQLGIEKAVPKRILELMNVPGLTRENVASHLQKFRLYLKRISSVAQHQNGLPSSLLGPMEPNAKLGSVGGLDFHVFAASGQIPPQTLAALHAEFLGHPSDSLVLPAIDQPVLQASRQGPKYIPLEGEITFGKPLFKCQSKQFPLTSIASENVSTGFSMWSSNYPGKTDSIKSLGGVNNAHNGNMMIQMLQQQHQSFPVLSESHHAINVQPSCLIVPSRSSSCLNIGQSSLPVNQNSIVLASQLSKNFQLGNGSVAINPSSNFNSSNIVLDYSFLPSLSNNAPLGVGQTSDRDITSIGVANGSPGSIGSSVSSCSAHSNSDSGWQLQNPRMKISSPTGMLVNPLNLCSQGSESKMGRPSDHGQARNLGFVGKGSCIPSRFAVDDDTNDQSTRNTGIHDGGIVKQEFHLNFSDSSQAGTGILPPFSSSNIMGVLSKYGLEGAL